VRRVALRRRHTTRLAAEAVVALFGLGCGRAVGTGGPPPLDPDDTRSSYLGEWRLEFALDSTRQPGRKPNEWSPARDSSARARGTVTVRDSLLDPEDTPLAADYALDFTPLLGRQISCLSPDAGGIDVEEEADSVSLWFTPRAFDCGFLGDARRQGDTLAGTWEETSLAGPVARGRFRMWRP
jgi:hypothetical protein